MPQAAFQVDVTVAHICIEFFALLALLTDCWRGAVAKSTSALVPLVTTAPPRTDMAHIIRATSETLRTSRRGAAARATQKQNSPRID